MLGRPPGGRSRRGRGWTRTACTSHRCDRAGTSGPGCCRLRSHCHPTTRGSEKAETSPSGGREKGGGRGRGESLGLDHYNTEAMVAPPLPLSPVSRHDGCRGRSQTLLDE